MMTESPFHRRHYAQQDLKKKASIRNDGNNSTYDCRELVYVLAMTKELCFVPTLSKLRAPMAVARKLALGSRNRGLMFWSDHWCRGQCIKRRSEVVGTRRNQPFSLLLVGSSPCNKPFFTVTTFSPVRSSTAISLWLVADHQKEMPQITPSGQPNWFKRGPFLEKWE
jgi:hypothetical protein